MRNLIFVAGVALLIASCTTKKEAPLSRATMEQVLFDITLAEAASAQPGTNHTFAGAKNADTLATYYADVLAHHHLTREQFQTAMLWYEANLPEFDTIIHHISLRYDSLLEHKVLPLVPIPANTPVTAVKADTLRKKMPRTFIKPVQR